MAHLESSTIPRRYSAPLWLAGGGVAFVLCLYHLSAVYADGVFVPAEHDSFYHARRIVDALADPLRMAQFDARIHAPEGSWITWPWGYDMLMTCLAKALMWLTGLSNPVAVLAPVAPVWVFVNAALFLGIASRLRLSLPMRAFAMLFFAISPMTQNLHRIGMLDHHYVEYTFVLATVYLGLAWFENLSDRRWAAGLGVLLGAAPAFHNGLFILQLPALLTIAWLWALGRPLDRRAMLWFGASLVASTTLFVLPSEPFRRGDFSYYLHSWFHLYIAVCTAVLCVAASAVRAGRAAFAAAFVLAAVMALPVLHQLELGRDFLFARAPYLNTIAELGSIPQEVVQGRLWGVTRTYSALLWLLPLAIAGLAWRLRRDARDASIHFFVQALVGSFLLLQTFRLHYFGSFALVLPLCLLVDEARALRPALFASRLRVAALALLAVATVLPGLDGLGQSHALGSDFRYMMTRQIYPVLNAACRRAPGVVLADHGDGHYIRYHSDCAVISNNFLTTSQHVEKVKLSEELLAGSLAEALRRAPYVRYVMVRRDDNVLDDAVTCGLACPENAGLRRELLQEALPADKRVRLLGEVRIPRRSGSEPLVRLYEVSPP